jgi:hypothetical protein
VKVGACGVFSFYHYLCGLKDIKEIAAALLLFQ